MIKSWQVAAEGFVSPEDVPLIPQPAIPEADPLNWISQHLDDLRARYPVQWIAVREGEVRASAPTIPILLAMIQAQALEKPFVTQVPATEVTWAMTYARQIV